MSDIVIPNREKFEELKKKILEGGVGKLHIVADFDRTLTKSFVDGHKIQTTWATVRNRGDLGEEYIKKAHQEFDKYHPIEISTTISQKEKDEKMVEWWTNHLKMLVHYGFSKELIEGVVRDKMIQFRDGSSEFFDLLHKNNIPLVILSAGLGDIIKAAMKAENFLNGNAHIVSNFLEFDNYGKAVRPKGKIIHSQNKHETEIRDSPIFKDISHRNNVLLLGDVVADLKMADGSKYENLMKIGFLSPHMNNQLEHFKESFDVVLLNDCGMGFINQFLKELI